MDVENDFAKRLVMNRSRRASATILTHLEQTAKAKMSPDEWSATRSKVLDSVNDLADVAIDIVKSDTSQMNAMWVEKLDEMHATIRSLARDG